MPILTRAYTRSQASQPVPEPTTIVEFHIFKSLPDNKPTIVKREYQFTNATQYLILCQRRLVQVQIWKKFFGILAYSREKDVLLLSRTLIFTNSRISPHLGRSTWANLEPTQSTTFGILRSVFSLISLAGFFLKQRRIRRELLATYGCQTMSLFSKVRQSLFFFSLLVS